MIHFSMLWIIKVKRQLQILKTSINTLLYYKSSLKYETLVDFFTYILSESLRERKLNSAFHLSLNGPVIILPKYYRNPSRYISPFTYAGNVYQALYVYVEIKSFSKIVTNWKLLHFLSQLFFSFTLKCMLHYYCLQSEIFGKCRTWKKNHAYV